MTTKQGGSVNDLWLTQERDLLSKEAKGLLGPTEPANRTWDDPRLAETILHELGPRWSQAVEEFKRTGELSILLFAQAHETRLAFQLGVRLGRSDSGKQARKAAESTSEKVRQFALEALEKWVNNEWPKIRATDALKTEKPSMRLAIDSIRPMVLEYQEQVRKGNEKRTLIPCSSEKYRTIRRWIDGAEKTDLFDQYHKKRERAVKS